jgi:hypothetical protein
MSDDPMHIDNVRARRAADEAEQDMYRGIAREIDGPPPPGIGALLKRAPSCWPSPSRSPSSASSTA